MINFRVYFIRWCLPALVLFTFSASAKAIEFKSIVRVDDERFPLIEDAAFGWMFNSNGDRFTKADRGVTVGQGTAANTNVVSFRCTAVDNNDCSGAVVSDVTMTTGGFTFVSGRTYFLDANGIFAFCGGATIQCMQIEILNDPDVLSATGFLVYNVPNLTCNVGSSTCTTSTAGNTASIFGWTASYP